MIGSDVVIVGVGAIGAATLFQLARRGVTVVGIDRFAPPHDLGSSHGETRVTRQATGEGRRYVPLAIRSNQIWRELEAATGDRLLNQCGFLAIDGSSGAAVRHGRVGFFDSTTEVARACGIDHEVLTPGEAMHRFPNFQLRGDERCYFEPGGGVIFPERAIAAQCRLAEQAGAKLQRNETVLAITAHREHAEVRTAERTYRADTVVVAAGAWTPGLIGAAAAPLRILREVVHWFAAAPADFAPGCFPTFMWLDGAGTEDSFYGFPIMAGGTLGLKVAAEQFSTAISGPGMLDRTVTVLEAEGMYARHVAGRIGGVGQRVIRSSACIYTHAPDGHFVIDRHPTSDRILIASACSGHGFKHSAAVGEHIAEVVTGRAALDPMFSLSRPAMTAINSARG